MSWTDDPELARMFREELVERASALTEGAVRYAARDFDTKLAADMYREGHSVKGTARVMGFTAIGDAGRLLEGTWRLVESDELDWSAEVADALISVAESLPDALDADPAEGTTELAESVEGLRVALTAIGRPPSPEGAPPAESERRPPLADPVPFDVSDVVDPRVAAEDPTPVSVGHERPDEIAAAGVPSFDDEDDVPSTLDMLRARAGRQAPTDPVSPAGPTFPAAPPSADPPETSTSARAEDSSTESVSLGAVSADVAATTGATTGEETAELPVVDIANLEAFTVVNGLEVGGLLGAVQDWATGQTLTVPAGRLYRMINGLAALRIDAEALLHRAQSSRIATGYDPGDLSGHVAALASELAALERQSIALTAVPMGGVLATIPQLVGFVSRKLGKQVTFESTGDEVLVDRAILDAIGDPIRQLVVNAVVHGIEDAVRRKSLHKAPTGKVSVDVEQLEGQIQVTVADDGAGVDWEGVGREAARRGLLPDEPSDAEALLPVLFSDGFSTAPDGEFGSAGGGLTAVAAAIETLLGRLSLHSESGRGTIVRFTVPTTRALQRIVIVEEGGLRWGLPDTAIDQILPLADADVDWDSTRPALRIRGTTVPLYAISQVVGGGTATLSEILVVSHRAGTAAFAVGKVEMVREVATKELGPLLQGPKHITGAALLGAGEVVLVLDPYELVERAKRGESPATLNGPRLLVVDDSPGVRAVVTAALSSNGFVASSVSTVAEALDHMAAHHVDAIVVDYQMPGENGISLVRRVREGDPVLPIVMLSAVADVDDQKVALEAGANAVLDKSDIREGALAATLHHLITSVGRAEPKRPTQARPEDVRTTSL